MKTIALIPIKFNNRRLPGKNIKPLGGRPLMQYIQETLLQVKGIDEIYVYCSDEGVKEYLLPGVCYLQRPQSLDQDSTKINEVLASFAQAKKADLYLLTHATAPFIKAESIQKGIDAVKSGNYDSAFAVIRQQDFLWQNGKPLNYDLSAIPRTQDLEPIYRETCGFYFYSYAQIVDRNRRIGENPCLIEVDEEESVDIDEADDFAMAECVLNMKVRNNRGYKLTYHKCKNRIHAAKSICNEVAA